MLYRWKGKRARRDGDQEIGPLSFVRDRKTTDPGRDSRSRGRGVLVKRSRSDRVVVECGRIERCPYGV